LCSRRPSGVPDDARRGRGRLGVQVERGTLGRDEGDLAFAKDTFSSSVIFRLSFGKRCGRGIVVVRGGGGSCGRVWRARGGAVRACGRSFEDT